MGMLKRLRKSTKRLKASVHQLCQSTTALAVVVAGVVLMRTKKRLMMSSESLRCLSMYAAYIRHTLQHRGNGFAMANNEIESMYSAECSTNYKLVTCVVQFVHRQFPYA